MTASTLPPYPRKKQKDFESSLKADLVFLCVSTACLQGALGHLPLPVALGLLTW